MRHGVVIGSASVERDLLGMRADSKRQEQKSTKIPSEQAHFGGFTKAWRVRGAAIAIFYWRTIKAIEAMQWRHNESWQNPVAALSLKPHSTSLDHLAISTTTNSPSSKIFMLNIITDIQHMHVVHRHGSVSITILCFCATADRYSFSLAEYITYEQTQTLELVLESSRKAVVGYKLLIQLQDGSATCKLNILKMLT